MKVNKKGIIEKKLIVSPKTNFLSIIPYLLFFVIGLVVHSKVISFGLVEFDDKRIIEKSIQLSNEDTFDIIFHLDPYFTNNSTFYRPIQNLTILIDNYFKGSGFESYHLTNLFIHIIVVSLIHYLFLLFGYNKKLSFLISTLYLVHPLFAFNVAWIPARGDSLVTLFSLASFIFLLRYIYKQKIIDIISHSLFFILALLSKELALILPLLFLLYFIFNKNENDQIQSKKPFIVAISIWLICSVFYFLIKPHTETGIFNNFGFSEFISNLRYYPTYLQKLFLPVNLSGMSQFNTFNYFGYLFIGLIGLAIYIFRKNLNLKRIMFYFIWFILLLIPVIIFKQTYVPTQEFWEHRAYLPIIGIFLILIELIEKIRISANIKNTILAIIFLIFIPISIIQSKNYTNAFNFYDNIIKKNNELSNAYFGRGVALFNEGKFQESLSDFDKSISLNPDYNESIFKRGITRFKLKNSNGAIEDFKRVILLKPEFIEAYENLGNIYYITGNSKKSLLYFNLALEKDPNNKRILEKLRNLKF